MSSKIKKLIEDIRELSDKDLDDLFNLLEERKNYKLFKQPPENNNSHTSIVGDNYIVGTDGDTYRVSID